MSVVIESKSKLEFTSQINAIIIEDQAEWQIVIKKLIKNYPILSLKGIYSELNAAKKGLEDDSIDLVFLDVEINDQNGIEFIKNLSKNINTIIISSHSKYALDSYDIEAIDYLTKPIDFERFDLAVQKVIRKIQNEQKTLSNTTYSFCTDYILIKKDLVLNKISFNEILYVSALENYIKIHTNTQNHLVLATLHHFEKAIHNHPFLRVHRSFVINLNSIKQIEKEHIVMSDDNKIPIGGFYKNELHEVFIKGKIVKRHI